MQGRTCWKQALVRSPRRAKELCRTSGIGSCKPSNLYLTWSANGTSIAWCPNASKSHDSTLTFKKFPVSPTLPLKSFPSVFHLPLKGFPCVFHSTTQNFSPVSSTLLLTSSPNVFHLPLKSFPVSSTLPHKTFPVSSTLLLTSSPSFFHLPLKSFPCVFYCATKQFPQCLSNSSRVWPPDPKWSANAFFYKHTLKSETKMKSSG